MADPEVVISSEVVDATIAHFTQLDASADERSANKMARRLGKEQPALLHYVSSFREQHGSVVGEAAMFYCTLVWAIFDRQFPRKQRLTQDNIDAAKDVVAGDLSAQDGLSERPVHERVAASAVARQPHIYAKIQELIAEDVAEDAMTEECAGIIFEPTQVIVEAFDAAMSGRRPGERVGPIVRDTPKVGRNQPCPCGSGKKYKKCHGKAA